MESFISWVVIIAFVALCSVFFLNTSKRNSVERDDKDDDNSGFPAAFI